MKPITSTKHALDRGPARRLRILSMAHVPKICITRTPPPPRPPCIATTHTPTHPGQPRDCTGSWSNITRSRPRVRDRAPPPSGLISYNTRPCSRILHAFGAPATIDSSNRVDLQVPREPGRRRRRHATQGRDTVSRGLAGSLPAWPGDVCPRPPRPSLCSISYQDHSTLAALPAISHCSFFFL